MKRALLITAAVVTVVVVAAGLVYGIGVARMGRTAAALEAEPVSQNTVEPAAPEEPSAEVVAEPAAPDARPADSPSEGAAQEVPPPDPNSPFAKDIPGCICHSDDPKMVKEHACYRMNQCSGCHSEGVPTGQ